jgi:hypothetical protein
LSPDRKQASLSPERFALAKWPIYQVIDLYVSARSAGTHTRTAIKQNNKRECVVVVMLLFDGCLFGA